MNIPLMYVSGSDLVCSLTETDSAGAGIDGLTIKFSIRDFVTGLWWDDGSGAFDSALEVLNTSDIDALKSALGLYEYALTGGVSLGGTGFWVHVQATETVTGDVEDFLVPVDNVLAIGKPLSGTLVSDIASINQSGLIVINTAIPNYKFGMLSASTGELTAGFTVTAYRKLDAGSTWVAMTGSIIDDGSGAYSIDINAADTNGQTGEWRLTAPGAKTTLITFKTVPS